MIEILESELKNDFSLYLNINNKNTNVIYGEVFSLIYGEQDYYSEMLGLKYKIGVRSFMHVNSSVCAKLYTAVKSACELTPNTTVIDAYSGAGLMTALLASGSKKAIGIEIVPEAVACADELARINGLTDKIRNFQGKCEEILPDIMEEERKKNSQVCLVLDPPRKGCDKNVIEAVIKSNVNKIVYVSCMPSTLARDIGLICGSLKFSENGIEKVENSKLKYDIEFVKPFDMFSQTKHVETLVCLRKRSSN